MNAARHAFVWLSRHAHWLKWPLALLLLAYLFSLNRSALDDFWTLASRFRWSYFWLAFVLCGGSIMLTFVRWWLLVWALDLPFRVRDALRLGFIGYLFNYVGPGAVGGDLYKAVMIAAEQKSRRAVAVATILLDRILGLLALFMVAAIVSFLPVGMPPSWEFETLVHTVRISSLAGLVGLAIVLIPGSTSNRWVRRLERLPVGGRIAGSLLDGFALYQARPLVLVLAVTMSLVGHLGMLSSFYLCALAVNSEAAIPSYLAHLLFVPAAEMAGMIPIFPAGVGALEGAMQFFYSLAGSLGQDGFLTGVTYRILTVLVAVVGGGYYLTARKQIDAALHEFPPQSNESSSVPSSTPGVVNCANG